MEEHHPIAIATFPHQPKQPPPQKPTNFLPWQSQESTQPKCNGRESSNCDCHFPTPTQTTPTPKSPLTFFPGNRKSQLSQSAMEEHHTVAIDTFPPQPKPPPPPPKAH